MELIADRLTEKLHSLNAEQLTEVERFIESLQNWELDRSLTRSAATISEPAFAALWNNPDDQAYDAL